VGAAALAADYVAQALLETVAGVSSTGQVNPMLATA
jgi:hypothetical protein